MYDSGWVWVEFGEVAEQPEAENRELNKRQSSRLKYNGADADRKQHKRAI